MTQQERRKFLIEYLLNENQQYKNVAIPTDENEQKQLFRALVNVRPAKSADDEFFNTQNIYLQQELKAKGITPLSKLTFNKDNLCVWQGDITTLKVDAIVNAANSEMTGCYHPNHSCIDNCIHTFSGLQLRLECAQIMEKQGYQEPTGQAKITPAYNLPCKYILHTVGPVIYDSVSREDEKLLASCYYSCLKLAQKHKVQSIAFCCISTGVFRFPNDKAAKIAIDTVRNFNKDNNSQMKVIFNVFKDADKQIYEQLLG